MLPLKLSSYRLLRANVMPEITPEAQGVSIVAVGNFNPAILHPAWFAFHGLIRQEEAETALKPENGTQLMVSKELTVFSCEWFSLQVVDERFAIETKDPTKYRPLRDLAMGTFRVLEHTPIHLFGLNKTQHFRLPSEPEWHGLGHYYAPKQSWNELLDSPGMRSLTIQGKRRNCPDARIQIRLEPSVAPIVMVHVNEHYGPDGSPPKNRMSYFLSRLQSGWDDFLVYCDAASQHVIQEGLKKRD